MTITISNLSEVTDQEVFDHVVIHLLTQGKKSQRPDGSCLYYHPRGLRCAAGCLIAPDEYCEIWESETWISLVDDRYVPADHADLITELQLIHDDQEVIDWPDLLRDLANTYNLNTNVMTSELIDIFNKKVIDND